MKFVSASLSGYDLGALPVRFSRGLEAGTTAVGKDIDKATAVSIARIYTVPEDRSSTGREKWHRTGALMRGRHLQFSPRWEWAMVSIRGERALPMKSYPFGVAQRRHQLEQETNQWGKEWKPNVQSTRINPYFEEAFIATAARAPLIFASNFNGMQRR
jgi:hypothetical protein